MTTYQQQRTRVYQITKMIREAGETMLKARMLALDATRQRIYATELIDLTGVINDLHEQVKATASNLQVHIRKP